jgi:hypothetical protein
VSGRLLSAPAQQLRRQPACRSSARCAPSAVLMRCCVTLAFHDGPQIGLHGQLWLHSYMHTHTSSGSSRRRSSPYLNLSALAPSS